MANSTVTFDEWVAWHVIYLGMASLALILNLFVAIAVPAFKFLGRRPANWFFWAISLAYILQAIFYTPFSFRPKLLGYFDPPGAYWLCKVKPWVLENAYFVESILLLALACFYIDRIRKGYRPVDLTGVRFGPVFLTILITWIFSILVSFPWSIFRSVELVNGVEKCRPTSKPWYKIYNDYVSFLGCAIVVVLADILFVVIGFKIRSPRVRLTPEAKTDLAAGAACLVAMNMVWLPTGLIFLFRRTDPTIIPKEHQSMTGLINAWWHDTAGLWNVLILLILNKMYRRAFKAIFCCQKPPPEPSQNVVVYDYSKMNPYYAHSIGAPWGYPQNYQPTMTPADSTWASYYPYYNPYQQDIYAQPWATKAIYN